MPKSIRKFIRQEKARIRRQIFDPKEQAKAIEELYQRIYNQYGKSTVKQSKEIPNKPRLALSEVEESP